jgi:hypothetical protein
MSQGLTGRECFICKDKGFPGVMVDLEDTGKKNTKGKPVWKFYENNTNDEHKHRGDTGRGADQAEEFKKINTKLDQIINLLKGQGSLDSDVQSNE